MAENQWYPALGNVLTTGVGLQLDDVVGIGKVAGLAGAPAMKFFFWIDASAQYPSF